MRTDTYGEEEAGKVEQVEEVEVDNRARRQKRGRKRGIQ